MPIENEIVDTGIDGMESHGGLSVTIRRSY